MTAFYTVPLQRCGCGKPATVTVMASGNTSYGVACDKCGAAKVQASGKDAQRDETHMREMPIGEYLIIAPETPTDEEYKRGARLIPSMLEAPDCIRVWRVPALPTIGRGT